ncbi:MAG: BREX system P-loop protein BrxC [Eubacteriaceae bacterium]
MKIKNMFSKPIDRDIKGVIKVGQGDDLNVKQELEEYVVTRELQKHFADFFGCYKKGILENTDKMGVWISGFFGSGKSHFLKILSYLLENRVVDGKSALDYFSLDKKIKDEMVIGDMKLAANTPTDVILFNIDSKSGMADSQNNKEAILSVFLKVFNEYLGFCGTNHHLADLERTLTEEGKYEDFKHAFLSLRKQEWTESRHQFRFIQDDVRDALVNINFMSEEAAKNACESFTAPYNMDISTFSKMIRDYIDKKGNNHHVIFLVDEMGQYIGENTNLMLNLQTLTEDLGTACKGKAWIIVTSQQDIDKITKTRGNDFSKIQGRFDTRLSLSSANVDEVIRKRILEKTEAGTQTLSLLYDDKDTILKNLILFDDGVEKKLYSNRINFAKVYPFIPYQFNLLGAVLTSIRKHGASGKHLAEGERSMLALFKESAMKIMDKEEGALVPFNLFYDALEQFLDHSHKGVISQAKDNTLLNPDKSEECFEVNVLKTLFMIKYVKEITPNLENITSLMICDIDNDRIALKDKVENALKRLCHQTLVQKNGGIYVFLSDEEQEINREIETQNVETSEITGKISELIFDVLYTEKKVRVPKFHGRYTFGFNQFVDDRPYKANQHYDISLKILTPNFTSAQMNETTLRSMSSQGKCVIIALPDDSTFIDEIRSALKIERYLRLNTFYTLSKYEEIKKAKQTEMDERRKNAGIFLSEALKEASIYVNGDKVQSTSKEISSRINDALGKLIDTVFHKLSYIDTPMGETEIKALLKVTDHAPLVIDKQAHTPNSLALQDVLDFVSTNTKRHFKTSRKSIMERFTKTPYGFIETDVSWLMAKLFKDGDLDFFVNNQAVTHSSKSEDEIYRYLTRKEFLEKLLTGKREKANDKQKKAARDAMKELFNITPIREEDDVIINSFMKQADNLKNELEKLEIHYENTRYPGKEVVKAGKKLMLDFLSIQYATEFFKTITAKQGALLDFSEDYEPIKAFFNGEQKDVWDRSLNLMTVYNDSKSFIVNDEIEVAVSSIEAILKKPKPFSDIRKLPALRDSFNTLYSTLLKEMEAPVANAIDEAKGRVMLELKDKACLSVFSGKVSARFDELKEKAETCNNVATLQNITLEADTLKVRFLNEIATEEAKRLGDRQSPSPGEATPNRVAEPSLPLSPGPKAKKQKSMSIKSINAESTWRIETEADVDRYVGGLKRKLKESIKEDIVLNIEF